MWVNMGEVEENMFMNEYSHTIDSKGRMILPTKFREELGNVFITGLIFRRILFFQD